MLPLFAAPILHFARVDDRVYEARFYEVREEPSAQAVWKKDDGAYRAWTLRDRRVIRAERLLDGQIAEVVRYDVTGRAESRGRVDGTELVSVWVDGGEVDVRGWTAVEVGSVSLPMPPGQGSRRDVGEVRLDAVFAPSADVFAAEFAEQLEAGCGCRVLSGATTWLAGKPVARFSASLDGGDRRTAELWAVPVDGGTLLVASSAPDWRDHTLVRAMMATWDFEALSR